MLIDTKSPMEIRQKIPQNIIANTGGLIADEYRISGMV